MDIDKIKQVFELFDNSDAIEFKFEDNETKFLLRKQSLSGLSAPVSGADLSQPVYYAPVPDSASITNASQAKPAAASDADTANLHEVTSPLVGTFYASSSPTDEPFVNVGDKVKKGQTLCIVEAMKVMNEIESDVDGEIAEVLTSSAMMVEFGTPLFRIKKA